MSQEKSVPAKPLPVIDQETEAWWQAAREGYLGIPTCQNCGHAFYYPRRYCPNCLSDKVEIKRGSGRGTIYSYTVAHRHPNPAFHADVPYVVALIDLEEGPRMLSQVKADPKAVKIGAAVEVAFEERSPEINMFYFKLV